MTEKRSTGRQLQADGTVRVWSTVGATVPIPDSFGNIKFNFGHERIARSDSVEQIKKTEALIHEFNEEVLEKRVQQYLRMFQRLQGEVSEEGNEDSVQARAKKKLKKKKKGKG